MSDIERVREEMNQMKIEYENDKKLLRDEIAQLRFELDNSAERERMLLYNLSYFQHRLLTAEQQLWLNRQL